MGIPIIQVFYGRAGRGDALHVPAGIQLSCLHLRRDAGQRQRQHQPQAARQSRRGFRADRAAFRPDRLAASLPGGKRAVLHRLHQYADGHDGHRSSLAHSDIRAAFSNPRLYRVSLLRLIVMPLVFIGLALVVRSTACLPGHLRDRRRHADCRKLQHAFRYLYAGGYDRLSRDHRFHPAQRRDPAAARRRDEYGGAGIMQPAP